MYTTVFFCIKSYYTIPEEFAGCWSEGMGHMSTFNPWQIPDDFFNLEQLIMGVQFRTHPSGSILVTSMHPRSGVFTLLG
jgi:hypothetical protein